MEGKSMSEAENEDSRKAVIAELVSGAHGALTAVRDELRLSCGGRPATDLDVQMIGELLLTVWSDLPDPAQKPGGRIARSIAPLSVLRARGWQILPVPSLGGGNKHYPGSVPGERHEGLALRLWWMKPEWVAVPPEGRKLPVRRFRGPGLAQRWATEVEGLGEGVPQ